MAMRIGNVIVNFRKKKTIKTRQNNLSSQRKWQIFHEIKQLSFPVMGLGVQETRGERELSLLSGTMMLEQLKEELQILETQYPNRFGYLKLELKSFIFLLETQNSSPNSFSLPTPSSVTTQASTTSKKRGDCDGYLNERRDRVDEVIERAQACLNKIQQFKTCFR